MGVQNSLQVKRYQAAIDLRRITFNEVPPLTAEELRENLLPLTRHSRRWPQTEQELRRLARDLWSTDKPRPLAAGSHIIIPSSVSRSKTCRPSLLAETHHLDFELFPDPESGDFPRPLDCWTRMAALVLYPQRKMFVRFAKLNAFTSDRFGPGSRYRGSIAVAGLRFYRDSLVLEYLQRSFNVREAIAEGLITKKEQRIHSNWKVLLLDYFFAMARDIGYSRIGLKISPEDNSVKNLSKKWGYGQPELSQNGELYILKSGSSERADKPDLSL